MEDCVEWDLAELSKKSGKSELEIAKTLFGALVMQAEVNRIPLRVECRLKGREVAHKEGEG